MYHTPALLNESIDALEIKPDGIYVDVTFGGGGHSREILSRLKNGKLIAFDRDTDAHSNLIEDDRITLIPHDFIFIKKFLRHLKSIPVNGILADLGISSHQIDEGERGFSFRFDAPLDMRMDRQNPISAKEILNTWEADALQRMFSMYGEIKNAKTLAREIVQRRSGSAITTTGQLANIAEDVLPAKEKSHKYLATVFQALRIEVNNEMNGLQSFLLQAENILAPGGRLAVITYHSLEDRPVKNFFQTGNFEGNEEKDIFGNAGLRWKQITRKPIIPTDEEIARNPRVRSAKLRVAEKI
jgi:16S rRNA (cytosine1402-N4)-methyltransferase